MRITLGTFHQCIGIYNDDSIEWKKKLKITIFFYEDSKSDIRKHEKQEV